MVSKPSETANKAAAAAKDAVEDVAAWAKRTGGDDVGAQIEVLRKDLAHLSETIATMVANQANEMGDRVRGTVDHARAAVDDLGERGRDLANRAQKQASTMGREVENTIERNPVTAVLVALGVGFIAGLISRNR